MKYLLSLAMIFLSANVYADMTLRCRTEKTETAPSELSYTATDSNQRILLPLYETTKDGKTILINKAEQILKYEFSQSSGGESPWSLVVTEALVDGQDIQLNIKIKKDQLDFFVGTLKLKVYSPGGEDSQVAVLNEQLAINGSNVAYNPTEDELNEMLSKFGQQVRQKKLVLNDLAWLEIANCRLM